MVVVIQRVPDTATPGQIAPAAIAVVRHLDIDDEPPLAVFRAVPLVAAAASNWCGRASGLAELLGIERDMSDAEPEREFAPAPETAVA